MNVSPRQRRPIRALPPALRFQIAAGEVVERPASVIKELVENSLDAGATRVGVSVDQGGLARIQVQDDGHGLAPEELVLAVTRHATSKIGDIQDLQNILTMGFRGEALPSIASVSRLTLCSMPAPAEADAAGGRETPAYEAACIQVDYGELVSESPAALPQGTRVEVRELFANVPARLKFLKTPAAEARRCQDVLFRQALAHLPVGFTLHLGGREALRLPPGESLTARLAHAWPSRLVEGLMPVDLVHGDMRAHGLTGAPDAAQARADRVWLFVNGRPVRDKMLLRAVSEAYRGRLISREYPQAVVFLELPPQEVDVNVHPAKAEVRFRDESRVFSIVRQALRQTLDERLRAAWHGADFDAPREARSPNVGPHAGQYVWPDVEADVGSNVGSHSEPHRGRPQADHSFSEHQPALFEDDEPMDATSLREAPPAMPRSGEAARPLGARDWSLERPAMAPEPRFRQSELPWRPLRDGSFEIDSTEPRDQSLFDAAWPAPPPTAQAGPAPKALRCEDADGPVYMGRIADSYLVLKLGERGLALLDQHAAHERVLFHRLKSAAGRGDSRPLVMPLEMPLHPSEFERLTELWDELRGLGFDLATREGRALELRALPASLSPADARDFIRAALEESSNNPDDGPGAKLDKLWVLMACKTAIKAGQPLADNEALSLLQAWLETPDRHFCPHGRPVLLTWSLNDLERLFKRI